MVDTALAAAVEVLRAEDRQAGGSAEPPDRTLPQLRMDAFVEIAAHYLATADGAISDSDRYLVTISAELPDLASTEAGSATVAGSAIPAETMRRLGCSEPRALLVHDRDGNPLWMGRRVRNANRAQRRAIVRRHDGHCAFPGCRVRSRLVPHHSEEWVADHGSTDVDLLVPLCRFHHRCVHEGGFRVRRDPEAAGRFRFYRPDCTEVPIAPQVPSAGSAEPPPATATRGPAPGDRLPFDLDLTVDALWCLLHPVEPAAGMSG